MFYSNDNFSFFFFQFEDPELFKKLKNPIHQSKDAMLDFVKTKNQTSLSSDELTVSQNIYKTRSGFQIHNIFSNLITPINYDEIVSAIESF